MALSRIEFDFYGRLLSAGLITPGGDVLEFGESEFHEEPLTLLDRWQSVVPPETLARIRQGVQAAQRSKSRYQRRFGAARAFYGALFEPASYTSADITPCARSIWTDLNRPFHFNRLFDICINNGTSEHVFNQANVFKAMHEHTKVGGLMIHWTPTVGRTDHGLYNVQPNFFFDLAGANQYRIEHIEVATRDAARVLPSRDTFPQAVAAEPRLRDSLVCAALRRTADAPFVMPMQHQAAPGHKLVMAYEQVFNTTYACGWKPGEQTNLARGKPAMQSSTSRWSFHDDRAMDAGGGNNGVITGSYGFHTEYEDRPWWCVDLGKPEPVRQIVVYNRLDAPQVAARAGHLRIAVSPDNAKWIELAAFHTPQLFGGADGHPLEVSLATPIPARYVLIGLLDQNYLHLDEIEIY